MSRRFEHVAMLMGGRSAEREVSLNSGAACAKALESEGYRVIYRGECRVMQEEEYCTREYAPVCAERNGRLRTFGNECEARNAPGNWRIISRGPC